MSGIAGFALQGGTPPTAEACRNAVARLGGSDAGPPLLLHHGRVLLAATGRDGYASGLLERRVDGASVALAFHGMLVPEPAPSSGDGTQGLLGALLTGFLEQGPDLFASLRGEFAIAIWDGRSETLHVATDRFRIQPLFFAETPAGVRFASRMAALLALPGPFRPTVDPSSVLDVVAGSIVAAPRTIFREVVKLRAGHRVSVHAGKLRDAAYWEPDFTHAETRGAASLAAETREALSAAVADRLERDRGGERFGAFLSGGIDSSTVTGLLTRHRGGPVNTFSIGFGEERFNELAYARIAANAFHSRHTEYFVTPADVAGATERIVEAFDEPFANASAVPTYYCALLARQHGATALYAGDAGDELFAGNERYATSRVFAHYDRIPKPIREAILTPSISAAGTLLPFRLFARAKSYVGRASLPPAERFVSYHFWNAMPIDRFATRDLLAAAGSYRPWDLAIRHYERARARTELDRQLYLDLKVTISDNDLVKVTRMCEAAGVAVRFPFLDERVVDTALRVPARLKMRGSELRTFFKDAFRDLLPRETLAKQKHGFGLPIATWLRSDPALHAMMRETVLGSRALARGYFQKAGVEELLRLHAADHTSFYGTVLWNLMMLELWHRRVLDAPGEAAT